MSAALLIAGAAAYLAIGVWISRHFLAGMRAQPLFQSAMEAAPERVAPIAALLSAFAALLWPAIVCFSLMLRESRAGLAILGEALVEIQPVREEGGGLSFVKVRWMTKPRWWQIWRLAAWKRCEGQPWHVFDDGLVVRKMPPP